jgi:hypothetical protein
MGLLAITRQTVGNTGIEFADCAFDIRQSIQQLDGFLFYVIDVANSQRLYVLVRLFRSGRDRAA